MKKIFIFFVLFFLNSFNLFAGNFDVVARVNDKIITNYDLNNYVNISQLFFKDTDNSKNFRQEILDWIVDNILKKEAIEKEKIDFDEDEFKYYLKSFEEKNQISQYNFNNDLYLDIIKTNFLWFKLINQKIKPTVSISESEVDDSLEYLIDDSIRTRYNISQIVVYERKNANSNIIADKIYKEIKENNNFENIAEKLSQDESSKKNKGYIGWVDEMEINEKIYNEIKNLKVDDITKPIYFSDTNSGFYLIIKLNDKKREKIAKQDDIARAKYYIYGQKLNIAIRQYLDNLYNNSFIEIINR